MGMPGWHVVGSFIERLSTEGRFATLYRGQTNADWPITPSAFRAGWKGISDEESLYRWKNLAARFASPMPIDNVEWLVFAQHYGLATPLLDWTTSPLVALYFACDDETQSIYDGAVWATDRADFTEAHNTLMIDLFKDDREKPLLVNAVGRNPRSTAQDSLMSLHTPNDYKELRSRKIFEVPSAAKAETLITLEKLGFTAERLHFDVTKLVDRIKAKL